MEWVEAAWSRVVTAKEFLFAHNVLFCRTICVPIHKVLRQYESYRYVHALAFGPDDEVWKQIGIPYVESRWLDGSIDFTKPAHLSDQLRTEEHGSVFGTYEGRTPVMVISDPNLIREMLGKTDIFSHRRVFLCNHPIHDNMLPMMDGDQWRYIRRLLMRKFSTGSEIRAAVPLIAECAAVCVGRVQEIADGDEFVECGGKTFGAFTMDLMGRIMFGRPFENHDDQDNEFIENSVKLLIEGREKILLQAVRYPEFWRTPENCGFDPDAMEFFKQYVIEAIEDRILPGTDLLQSLEDAESRGDISLDELYANATIVIALSYHSVSFVMAVTCWELSRNGDLQDKVAEEIDKSLAKHVRLTDQAIDDMPYLELVIKEALRKYPPGVRIERVCNRDTVLGGITVKRGTVVAVPLFTLHRKSETYPNPMQFDPNRFTPGSNTFGYAYLPFGESHRKCIAWRFALMEMKVFMAYLLSQIRLVSDDDSKEEKHLAFQSKKNILVADEIPFRVRRRTDRAWMPENVPKFVPGNVPKVVPENMPEV